MKSIASGPLPRSQQRWLFSGLGVALAMGLVQQLLFAPVAPMATLPPTLPWLRGWQPAGDPGAPAIGAGSHHPAWGRDLRVGASRRFIQVGGGWLVITPLAGWDLQTFALARIAHSLPGLGLTDVKLLTLIPKQRELALGKIQGEPAYQSCLISNGSLAASQTLLPQVLGHPDPGFRAKVLQSLVPSGARGYSCLLLTTNRVALLTDSAAGRELSSRLARATAWPR